MGQSHRKTKQSTSSAKLPPRLDASDASMNSRGSLSQCIVAAKRGFLRLARPGEKTQRVSAAEASGRRTHQKLRLVSSEDEDCLTAAQSSTESCDEPSAPSVISASYYILPKVVGAGIVGEVRRCLHLPTGEPCAVKTIKKSQVRRKDRLGREVAFLREVDHPNIIAARDVFEDAEEVHIVTELCRGGELFDRITERALWSRGRRRLGEEVPACFREEDAARVLRALLSAVAYLHERDIVHRDIKPENILFVDRKDGDIGAIKLIDFGLAVRHPPGARPLRSVVGTAYYMPPEVLAGSYDRSCDLWSVGVVTYTLLTGRPPFNGPTNDDIFEAIAVGRYRMEGASWRGVSEPARDFVRGLLATGPKQRMSAAEALEHPWLTVGDR